MSFLQMGSVDPLLRNRAMRQRECRCVCDGYKHMVPPFSNPKVPQCLSFLQCGPLCRAVIGCRILFVLCSEAGCSSACLHTRCVGVACR